MNNQKVATIPLLKIEELATLFGDTFAEMQNFVQNNPHHCFDLLNHSVQCCLNCDIAPIRKDKQALIKIACLYHDIGKLVTKAINLKTGYDCFYGHPLKGSMIAKDVFKKMEFNDDEIEYILFMIANHDFFMNYKFADEINNLQYDVIINEINVKKLIVRIQNQNAEAHLYVPSIIDFKELCQVAIADAKSQAEMVYMHNKLVTTKANKIKHVETILDIINTF